MFRKLRDAALTLGCLVAVLSNVAPAQQTHAWTSHDKIALSYYFYWYNVHDGEHFVNPDGSDALTNHPPTDSLANYSYTDVSWHQQQMQDMVAAGIDVALPVYWGNTADSYWSQNGLHTMVTALQGMAQAGTPFPGIGMFFDTTSLYVQNGNSRLDVTAPGGKATFYGMIHDFFSIVPKSLWATIDGRPILVLYGSNYLSAYDQSSLDYLSQQFQSDFGVAPYIIREQSWKGVVTDAAYAWGAALTGPRFVGDTAALGPGYDDSAVPNRFPHGFRNRKCGRFYQQGWDTVGGSTRLVFVETWNELHEATEVAATREYGRQYIDLTGRNVRRWKSGYAAAPLVWMSPGRDSFQSGLRIALDNGDGVWNVNRVAGRDAVDVDRTSTPPSNSIYLDVDDGFLHALSTPVWVTVEYLDAGSTPWFIEYDGAANPYMASPRVPMGNTGLWKRVTFAFPDAYFGGRENGGSDLRIDDYNTTGETHYFSRVWISKSPPSAPTLELALLAEAVVSPGATTELPLTATSSDGGSPSFILANAPEFASLQFRSGAPVLVLAPSISDAQACAFVVTIVAANGTTASLSDATSLRVLVPNAGSGVTCDYSLSLGGQAFAVQGGTGTITVTTGVTCPWMLGTPPAGVVFTSAGFGIGDGTVTFQVLANVGGDRSGSFTIAGQTFTIEQAAFSPPGVTVGSLAQVTSEGAWDFFLDLINLGSSQAQARVNFAGDDGAPLSLPLTFPQSPSSAGPELASTLDRTLGPYSVLAMESMGPATVPVAGWSQLFSTGNVSGFGIFSYPAFRWDAVVPLETRNAGAYVLPFDNTGSLATGLAIANLAAQIINVPVIIRDDTGAPIGTASIGLAAQGHGSFMLNQQYPVTASQRGTIEFDTPPGGRISVLGVRANGPALTTLPVLASGGISGGAIAHSTFNGGFTSTWYLVNMGATAASFTLSFFDEGGNPQQVPLSLPQSSATATTAALTRTLEARAMLEIDTQAQDALPLVQGSAQLATAGNISGFEIFRWTTFGQEASVPLETRTPNSFVLIFDNTAGLTTGLALSNFANQAASVTANLRDDTGALLQTASINVAAHGHTSFMLPDKYAVAAGTRGSVEFAAPAGGQIGVIGVRAKADGTLTTIPVLAK